MDTALVTSLGSRSTVENYGAVLQIVAFCHILKTRYNIKSDVLDYIGINLKGYSNPEYFGEIIYGRTKKARLKSLLLGGSLKRRFRKNLQFLKNECSVTDLYDYSTISSSSFKYDYYIAESDVIWDPTFRKGGFDAVFFLCEEYFRKGKRIVYSAGIGDGNFSDSDKEWFANSIEKIDNWSVRESYASKYLSDFIDDNIVVTIDPTLLVDGKYYLKYISGIRPLKDRYVLVYTPGYENSEMFKDALDFSKSANCKLVCISRTHMLCKRTHTKINVSPPEFLTWLYHCEALFCDSFHGVCLSVALEKEFYVYDRADGKKIPDICNRLGLNDRMIKHDNEKTNAFNSKIDYEKVHKFLNREKKDSLNFLDGIFSKNMISIAD